MNLFTLLLGVVCFAATTPAVFAYPSTYFSRGYTVCPEVDRSIMATTITATTTRTIDIFDPTDTMLSDCYEPGLTHTLQFASENTVRLMLVSGAGEFTDTGANSCLQYQDEVALWTDTCTYDHSDAIGCSGGKTDAETFKWTAPDAGAGTIEFQLITDAVGQNGPVEKYVFTLTEGCEGEYTALNLSSSSSSSSSSSGSATVEDGASVMFFEGEAVTFDSSSALTGGYDIFWTIHDDEIEVAIQAVHTGYLALGWPTSGLGSSSPMVGSNVIVAWDGQDGTNVNIEEFNLGGKSAGAVVRSDNLGVTQAQVSYDTDTGVLTNWYRRALVIDGVPTIVPSADTQFLYAKGDLPADVNAGLTFHSDRSFATVNFESGTVTGETVSAAKQWHGALMMLSWGVMIPLGAFAARYLKSWHPPLWWHLHRGLQSVGLLIAVIAFFLAVADFGSGYYTTHAALGWIITCIGVLQPINAIFRPHKEAGEPVSVNRQRWFRAHQILGYLALLMAVLQIFGGLTIIGADGGFFVLYGVIVSLLFLLYVGFGIKLLIDNKEGKNGNTELKPVHSQA